MKSRVISRAQFFGACGLVGLSASCRRQHSDVRELLIPSDPNTLDPRFIADAYALRISRLTFATLTAPHPELLYAAPSHAERLDREDGQTMLITLKPDLWFQDGSRLTARDVVATFEALAKPTLGAPARRFLQDLDFIKMVDDRRIRVRSKAVRATLAMDLDIPILKASEAATARDGALVGSGPFRFARNADAVLLTRVLDGLQIIIRTVRDESARALRMLGGGADLLPNALAPTLALELPARGDGTPGTSVGRRSSAGTTFLTFQCERPPIDRAFVRRAIAAAIDRPGIIQAKFGGAATLARGLLPPALQVPTANVRTMSRDECREVLAPLGRAGHRLSLLVSPDRFRIGIARAMAQDIEDCGLPVQVRSLEFGTLLARLRIGDFDLVMTVTAEVPDPDILRHYLHSQMLAPNGSNRARIVDPVLDDLLSRGVTTLDEVPRRALYAALEQRLAELVPIAPLWHEDHLVVRSARTREFMPSTDGRWGALADLRG